jgi:type I site-specific restriction-modification system R (restriction) subunit
LRTSRTSTFNVVTELTAKDDEEFRPDITLLINTFGFIGK